METPNTNIGPDTSKASDEKVAAFFKRFARAKGRRDKFNTIIDECYEFALPLRERVYSTGESLPDLDRLFDGTAPNALQDMASQMLDDIWPTDSKPFELAAGREIPIEQHSAVNRALAEVTEELTDAINNSNFRSAAHESLMDWGIATGFLLPEDGDAVEPLGFRSLPLTEAYPDTGPYDKYDALFRPRKVKAGDMKMVYKGGKFNTDLEKAAKETPEKEIVFIEAYERDWTNKGAETWKWCVAVEYGKSKDMVLERSISGAGSKPFVDFSYMRVAGEVLGRGPVMVALPDIKTINLIKEYMLESGDLALGGIWQADDDGVLNPDTVSIEPRTIIPKAPNSNGLQRIDTAVDFNIGEYMVNNLTVSIKDAMGVDDLGPPEGTPMSATEVLQRTSNRARRRAGPYTRLLVNLLGQTIRRVAYIKQKQGRIKLPAIDGRKIVLRPLSPLTRAQAQDEILRHDRYMEMLNMRIGPQAAGLVVKQEQYADWLAAKMGIDPNIVRNQVEREELAKAIAAATAAAQEQA